MRKHFIALTLSTLCAVVSASDAVTYVAPEDGGPRNWEVTGADTSQADGYPPVSESIEADLHFVRVGDERYEIPEAVIFGG